ncbi:class III signal peptide-containing protein [Thermococcus argininiproducens]|uniref:Class III signal peptide-containing protein n=1 Tax=Thermococcus argininiproducens TaxID=2866384 RepID=A0A9E7SDF6_9EURY|nr:class III signal peptide-containing protein [Thermococcus argininiproducens]USH00776.1 class III signal peptide-containing protein [Thermococcus argininiproducens]
MKRNAQAAIEYLMMVAIILIIVFVVIRIVRQTVLNAAQNIQNLTQTIIQELEKAREGGG